MQEELKSRLNMGNVCYHLVQCLFLSRLLRGNVDIKITIFFWIKVLNLVAQSKGITQAGSVQDQVAE